MKAIVTAKQGPPDFLQLRDVERPRPNNNEVLVRVHASTVTQGDVILRKLNPLLFMVMRLFGVRRKRIPGHEYAGEVVEVGSEVTKFKNGDKVFGTTTGLIVGANAEYLCVPESGEKSVISQMPANASYEEAAPLPIGGMTALEILKKGNIKPGERVLVFGASGSVGTFAVQIARHHFGAEVTGVCSTTNIELVKSLGAKHVIDYTQEDFAQTGQTYDVIFDAVGKISLPEVKDSLAESGTYLTVQTTTRESLENLAILKDLIESGKIKPVIDKRFPLEQTANAHRYVETGRKKGNVIINEIQS